MSPPSDSPFDTINILSRPAPARVEELAPLVLDAGQLVGQARSSWRPAKSRPIQVQCAALPSTKPSALDIFTIRASHTGSNPELRRYNWFGRRSFHAREAYKTFYQSLFVDHTAHEQAYIHILEEAHKLQPIHQGALEADVWGLTYHLPWPLKRRFFLELVMTVSLPPHPDPLGPEHLELVRTWLPKGASASGLHAKAEGTFRSFLVISLPVSLPDRPAQGEDKVWARYASVEAVIEGKDQTEWCMATQSDAGGLIKPWLADLSMASTIAADVPSFCNWAAEHLGRPSS